MTSIHVLDGVKCTVLTQLPLC